MYRKLIENKKTVFQTLILMLFFAIFVVIYILVGNTKNHIEITPNNIYNETIVIAVDKDYEPYSFYMKDGKPAGYDIELGYAIADRIGKNVEIRLLGWNEAEESVKNGEADLLMGLEYRPSDLPEYALSITMYNDPFVAFGKESFSRISELHTKKIAALKDSGSYNAFIYPNKLDRWTTGYSTYSEVFESIENNENKYAIARYSVGRRAVARIDNSKIKAVGPILVGNDLCVGAKKGNEKLIEEINSAIIELMDDGTISALGDKWLGKYVEIISVSDYFAKNINVIVVMVFILLLMLAFVFIYNFRQRLIIANEQSESMSRILEYQLLITEATKGLYESIQEFDITKGIVVSEVVESSVNASEAVLTYNEKVEKFAENKVSKEFASEYLRMFSSSNIIQDFEKGNTSLTYEFKIMTEKGDYEWVRESARIFYWSLDKSVHMIQYRQNINTEKEKEMQLLSNAERDLMTKLYNKNTTEKLISNELNLKDIECKAAFFIVDIDRFKSVNDNFGHSFGDFVISVFAGIIKGLFRDTDIVGRIGGDEFVIFLKNFKSEEWLIKKAQGLVESLHRDVTIDEKTCKISASIGIAVAPHDGNSFKELYLNADKALYLSKKNGKNCFTIFGGK